MLQGSSAAQQRRTHIACCGQGSRTALDCKVARGALADEGCWVTLQGLPLPVNGVSDAGAAHASVGPLLRACGAGCQRLQYHI